MRAARDDLRPLPCVLGIERHVFDEPDLVAGIARPPREVDDFIVVGPAITTVLILMG
jgi:hypothetical protein